MSIPRLLDRFRAISDSIKFSEKKIEELRKALKEKSLPQNICIVVVGSLARREASKESDIDFFVIAQKEDGTNKNYLKTIRQIIKNMDLKQPSEDGPFNELTKESDLLENLGGYNDNNKNLTRRMLFLLESDWLFNERYYQKLKEQLIERYIKSYIKDHQLPQFLLNDIIRYYRTIATDFEFKTLDLGKDWGIRNIKLRFSRKLLYFSAIIVVAEIGLRKCEEQRFLARQFFNMYPLERIVEICDIKATKVLKRYDDFLEEISKTETRKQLKNASYNNKNGNPEIFERLKNESKHFSWDLGLLLKDTFNIHHPIHHHLIF